MLSRTKFCSKPFLSYIQYTLNGDRTVCFTANGGVK